jgi:hypothetical protein
VDISASEVPAEAMPGVGTRSSTQERGQNKSPRTAATSRSAAGHKRPGRGGRPRAPLRRGYVGNPASRGRNVG